jgi:hypothetical protein
VREQARVRGNLREQGVSRGRRHDIARAGRIHASGREQGDLLLSFFWLLREFIAYLGARKGSEDRFRPLVLQGGWGLASADWHRPFGNPLPSQKVDRPCSRFERPCSRLHASARATNGPCSRLPSLILG